MEESWFAITFPLLLSTGYHSGEVENAVSRRPCPEDHRVCERGLLRVQVVEVLQEKHCSSSKGLFKMSTRLRERLVFMKLVILQE